MIYKLNNVPISSYGAYPALSSEKIALSGIFDCPKRKSPTERNWGTSIEPWVDEQDIILEGIEMSMDIAIPTASINLLKDEVLACTELDIDDENRNYCKKIDTFHKITSGGALVDRPTLYEWIFAGARDDANVAFRMEGVINSNGWWTVSFDLAGSQGGAYSMNVDICDNYAGSASMTTDNKYKRVSFSFNIHNFTGELYNFVDFNFPEWVYYRIRNIKIEKGNMMTDYMPAPEDQYFNQQVICKSECQVVEKKAYSILSAKFWKELPTLPELVLIASNSGDIRIDGFNLYKDFGVVEAKHSDLYSIPKRIDIGTTEPYPVVEYRESKELSFDLFMKGDSFYDLYFKMQQFQSLLLSPGMRSLYYYGRLFSCYFKSGFKASYVAKNVVKFTLKLSTND